MPSFHLFNRSLFLTSSGLSKSTFFGKKRFFLSVALTMKVFPKFSFIATKLRREGLPEFGRIGRAVLSMEPIT